MRLVYWILGAVLRAVYALTDEGQLYRSDTLEIFLLPPRGGRMKELFQCDPWPEMRTTALTGELVQERYVHGAQINGRTVWGFLQLRHKAGSSVITTGGDDGSWYRTESAGWTLHVCRGGRGMGAGYRTRIGDCLGPKLVVED